MIGTVAVLTLAIAAVPAFIASIVEWVEAFTIVLAVGNTRVHRGVNQRWAPFYLAAARASWYSARDLSPPLVRQSLTSPSRALSWARPMTMSETPSVMAWSSS